MKRLFKIIGKVIMYLLLFSILLTGFIFVSRKYNGSKAYESELAYKIHSQKDEIYRLSPRDKKVQKKRFSENHIVGYHHIPDDIIHKGIIISFGGSEGGVVDPLANYLSSDGYEVIAVTYFGEEGQPENVERIPLEIYEEVVSFAKKNFKNTDIITIVGISKGAELALILSTYYEDIDNVVLFSPTSHVVGSSYLEHIAPWTYKGKELNYLNGEIGRFSILQMGFNQILNKPYNQLILSKNQFRNSTNLEESRIKVENSNAKILIFYGGKDKSWDAGYSSKYIKQHAKKEVLIHEYKNAGHAFGGEFFVEHILNGGDAKSNLEADLDSKRILLETLELWHK